jgi:hypothetical protein
MTVLREELAKVPEEMRPMVEDLVSLGVQAMSDEQTVPTWMPIVGAAFATATMASLFYLLLRPEDIAATRHTIFNVWFSFCVTGGLHPKLPAFISRVG